MTAEILREAAALMRSRAKAALSDIAEERWVPMADIDAENHGWHVVSDVPEADWDTTIATLPYDFGGKTAPHIASWHPAVALAVADLLEADARVMEQTAFAGADWGAAKSLAVARAYLGESS